MGFPDGSVGKGSACNEGDPGSIPGSVRSTGEGMSYTLQCSWASLVAQLIKNPWTSPRGRTESDATERRAPSLDAPGEWVWPLRSPREEATSSCSSSTDSESC